MSDASPEVRHEPDQQRWAAYLDGELAGFAMYEVAAGTVTFTHTVVDDRYEGRGVGSALARAALDAVRDEGARKVVPQCRFIAGWIDKHPDYQDLVA